MDDSRRCTAKAKTTGERCRRAAIVGGVVCKIHGGGAPQVKRSAKQRLAALADPAIAALAQVLNEGIENQQWSTVVRAAVSILDRVGFHPKSELALSGGEEPVSVVHAEAPVASIAAGLSPAARRELLAAMESARGIEPTKLEADSGPSDQCSSSGPGTGVVAASSQGAATAPAEPPLDDEVEI